MERNAQVAVRTRGLTKQYGAQTVVEGLDLHVEAGRVYGFLGRNGAGKSTTMKMLLGLVRPTGGSIEVLGVPLDVRSAPGVLPRIGSLIESPSFYGRLSGWENLDIVRRVKGLPVSGVDEALDTVGLDPRERKPARQYSLGMKQRLGVAMALLGSPELLILDEPTNGLDPAGIHEMRELIASLPKLRGITVLLSSHILSEIEQTADTIGIIDGGRLRYQGPAEGLADAGQLVLAVDDPTRAAQLLMAAGWPVGERQGATLTLPPCPDEQIAQLVAGLVRAGIGFYRVEMRRRSLEDVFLGMTSAAGKGAA